jgi:predicted transposase/invertase (TIGR01784 family)
MARKLKELVRFDWAMKKLLRNKANFDILEGFLSELLGQSIKIKQILESESNKATENDKYNRVDMLVENSTGELVIIEVQNSKEYDYFHRILFGASKVITEHISSGEAYAAVKKVISITIAYFDLGQGKDYVYKGTTNFRGIHKGDVLDFTPRQKELYQKDNVYEIFPEYYLIKVSQFSNHVKDKLDEWIFFLKNGQIREDFTAQGLPEASKKLDEMKLSETERKAYRRYVRSLHDIASEAHTKMADAEELIRKGREEGKEESKKEAVLGFHEIGVSTENIAKALKITIEKVTEIINTHSNKKTN